MENDENLDLELETQDEEEVTTVEETDDTDDTELTKAQAEANKYRRLWEKSQKKPEQKPQATVQAPQQPASQNIEETVLLANGMDEELLGQLKKVAAVQGVSLIKAQSDPIFVAVKEKFEQDKKQKEVSLPVSRGSGQMKPKKDFRSPGLSEEEHRKMFEGLNL